MIIYLLYKNSCLYETDRRLLAAMRTAVREVAMQKQVEKKKILCSKRTGSAGGTSQGG